MSDDAVGRYCLAELTRYGVDATHVRASGGEARNSLAVTETRSSGCQSVLYRNGAADFTLSMADVAEVDFAPFAALVITGTALAQEPSRSATLVALARARASGALTVFDVDHRAYSWASPQEAAQVYLSAAQSADIVIGNDEEFGLIAGHTDRGKALAQRLAMGGAAFTIYKMGAGGSVTFTPDFSF